MLDILIYSLGSIYSLIVISVTIGMFRLKKSHYLSDDLLPTVSIIISSKNEEIDLPKCILSLEKIDYPKDKLQVVLVDDDSTDNTNSIIKDACNRNSHFKELNTAEMPETSLKAKARGIHFGISNADGDWIFITDADGEVQPQWLRHMLSRADEKTGMIGAMLSVKPVSFLAVLERMSWSYTLPFAFGMAGWGGSFICVGPNMGIRKSIYEDCGGLEKADFDVAEDLALFRMVEKSKYKTLSYITPETTIELNPVPSINHLWSQQRRWLKGGFEGGWDYGLGLMLGFSFHSILSFFLLTGWFYAFEPTLTILLMKLGSDLFMLLTKKSLLNKSHLFRYFPVQFLYVFTTMLWLPLSLLLDSKIRWKGDGYEIMYN